MAHEKRAIQDQEDIISAEQANLVQLQAIADATQEEIDGIREIKDELSQKLVELNALQRDESEPVSDPEAPSPKLADLVQSAEHLLLADREGMAVDGAFVRQLLHFVVSMGKKGEETTDQAVRRQPSVTRWVQPAATRTDVAL